MPHTVKDLLRTCISKNKLGLVFEILLENQELIEPDLYDQIITLNSKYSDLEKEDGESEGITIEKTDTSMGLLEVIEEIKQDLKVNPVQKKQLIKINRDRNRILRVIGFMGIMIFGLALGFSPKTNLSISGQLSVDQFSFIHNAGSLGLESKTIAEVDISFIERLAIRANEVEINGELESILPRVQNAFPEISLSTLPGSESVPIPFWGRIEVNHLPFSKGATISLSRPDGKDNPRLIRLLVSQAEAIKGQMSFSEGLTLQPEQVEVQGIPNMEEILLPTELKIEGPKGKRSEISFSSFPGNFAIDMLAEDDLNIDGIALKADSLSFYRKDENLKNQVPISTLLGGTIQIIEPGKTELAEIQIKERQNLDLISDTQFNIELLRIDSEGIGISFTGKVDKISIGNSREFYNPNWIEWLWHNHWLFLSALWIVFALGIVTILPPPLQNRIIRRIKGFRDISGI
ncbi:MAG: hypothetical protein AAFY41_05785 [Bacteroidota bacterium]